MAGLAPDIACGIPAFPIPESVIVCIWLLMAALACGQTLPPPCFWCLIATDVPYRGSALRGPARLEHGQVHGPVKVNGAEGAGKTVVLMHRAVHLSRLGKHLRVLERFLHDLAKPYSLVLEFQKSCLSLGQQRASGFPKYWQRLPFPAPSSERR
jgi:hypothetical protein